MVAKPVDLSPKQRKALRELKSRPEQFVRRCYVEDAGNRLRLLHDFWPEQRLWMRALLHSKQVIGLKPRQLGFTTITCLFFLWKAITTSHPKKSLQIVHEDQAVFRLAKMLRVAVSKIPPEIRPIFKTDNVASTIFARRDADGEEIDGPQFSRMLAGGSGQARSWTYNNIHATEMAHWRRATASNPHTGDGMSADEEAFASALATKHDPDGHIVVESTGNGPSGLFFDLFQRSQRPGSDWAFCFVPWTAVSRYEHTLTDEQSKELEAELDDTERNLHYKMGVSLGKISWRRWKKNDLGLSELAWRRNYPLVPMEPFLLDDLMWFSADALKVQARYCEEHLLLPQVNDLRIIHPFEPGRQYVMSCDTSGGTGRDEAVITVFRDDLLQVAIWASSRAKPHEQALWISRISERYGRPITLIEENKYGRVVIPLVEKIGNVRLWKTPEGKNFTTTESTKRMVYSHARELVDSEFPILQDPMTVAQLQNIIELKDGVIGARSGHDDRATAAVLAMFAWLKLRFDPPKEQQTNRESIAKRLKLFGLEGI